MDSFELAEHCGLFEEEKQTIRQIVSSVELEDLLGAESTTQLGDLLVKYIDKETEMEKMSDNDEVFVVDEETGETGVTLTWSAEPPTHVSIVTPKKEKKQSWVEFIEIAPALDEDVKDVEGFGLNIDPAVFRTKIVKGRKRLSDWFRDAEGKRKELTTSYENKRLTEEQVRTDGWIVMWMRYYRILFKDGEFLRTKKGLYESRKV